ncbi:DUF4954 family protein [Flavisolibacter tropicus]|uniref:DUF4954 domain-containing protein n=1 Tax=Flavisolibacter tropicus TaxID=1492898 RepID=A0A172TTZ4_9BACT|nr:DUF4954 family protein [Flavisolibacter tropicus]ANE50217.1 hypothetical protein SY85_06565 [Flavisolibacter tropicus]
MNEIRKKPLHAIGYNFVADPYLPAGADEYHLRNLQNRSGIPYRNLSAYEIEVLVRNNNTSDDWNKIQVSNAFNPELVKNCKFYGLVRIGKLETISLEFHNIIMPVGLYNSTIISCDFGDNVVVSNVNYMSHYIIGSEVVLSNIHELHVTNHSKFGNGIIKEGEDESVRVWLELCNENAGRKIIPFIGMLPGDAHLWSKYRSDELLMQRFREFTEKKFDKQRGYYGKVGDRSVIKNTSIIKDVWVGSDAYIKGANKLKNLTINSNDEAPSQIGEGCELVNGIINEGCRVFYGVKAVRFIMASHSQLKYGARLINSYLGNNATISCCEVLNSLIFPAHEQHHNNSFLCAATIMGQSNIAAGATIGSNHNSRAADGEIVAGRGFWPGLCVSLKHNSKFASFTLIAKGDYSYELNIPIPFSLISNDVSHDRLVVMPGFWFMYNMYALARNSGKYIDRDKRTDKIQHIEYDFLAPDTINEMFDALVLFKKYTAIAHHKKQGSTINESSLEEEGNAILNDDQYDWKGLQVIAYGFENNHRPTHLIKVKEAFQLFQRLIRYYGTTQLMQSIQNGVVNSLQEIQQIDTTTERLTWKNIGGQLLPETKFNQFIESIHKNTIGSWEAVHGFYKECGATYDADKLQHAYSSLLEIKGLTTEEFTTDIFNELMQEALATKEWMVQNIYDSRAKDYQSAFRKMVYDNEEEMVEVIGKLEDNVFIQQQQNELEQMRESVVQIQSSFK